MRGNLEWRSRATSMGEIGWNRSCHKVAMVQLKISPEDQYGIRSACLSGGCVSTRADYWMRHGMPCRWFGGKTKRVGCDCQGGLCCNVVASFSHPHLRPWPVPSIDLWPCLTRLGSTRRALPLLHSLPTGIESFSLQARNLTNVDQSLRFIEGVVETRVQI